MRSKRGYTAHLSADAVAFVVTLPKSKQRQVLDFSDALAMQPFRIGDYRADDAAGRAIENLSAGGFHFVYWVDHPAKEVRIIEIIRL